MCQTEKVWETMQKSFQRKDSGPTQYFFDVLPTSFRIPHSFTLTWTSGFHQYEENTLICLKTGSWKVMRFQRVLVRQYLQAASLKGNLGSRCYWLSIGTSVRSGRLCIILKILNWGGIGSPNGKSGSHWKLWCHSQICYCSQLGSPFDSWGLK